MRRRYQTANQDTKAGLNQRFTTKNPRFTIHDPRPTKPATNDQRPTKPHRYQTVNRNLGFELHLSRLKDYARIGTVEWAEKMTEVGWEEVMCAWRIVQPTLFNALYDAKPTVLPIRRRSKRAISKWHDTRSLVVAGTSYYPGSYLRNVHFILHFCALCSLGAMWGMFAAAHQYIAAHPPVAIPEAAE